MSEGVQKLKRDIGPLGAAFIALNGVVGAGIFGMPGALVEGAGSFSPYLVIIFGILVISIAAVLGELAGYFDKAGGMVVYADAAFGPFVGFQVGWLYYLARVSAFAANTNVVLTYLIVFAPGLDQGVARYVFIAALVLALLVINIAGVKQAVSTLNVLTVLKLTPLIVLTGWGLVEFSGSIPPPVNAARPRGDRQRRARAALRVRRL